jgi:flagellar L-ring protein precursor FlgH
VTKRRYSLIFTALGAMVGLTASPVPAADQPIGASFFADHRARNSGDVLTVLITETSSATETARTQTDKSTGVNASLALPPANQRQWQAALGSNFNGGGQIERSGQLLARLSVVVERIDEQGKLRVRGDQDIAINGERQRIHLEGAVRPDDIAPDNTVQSWRIIDAHISLVGKGVLGRAQSRGLLGWILHVLWLD